jgi:hypothetical protein
VRHFSLGTRHASSRDIAEGMQSSRSPAGA